MTHPKNLDQHQKLSKAPLPQKNAMQPPSGKTAEHEHEEELLDDALESTFPASDPVAEKPEKATADENALPRIEEEIEEHEEYLLDEALEMTFPASDPIAVPDLGIVEKIVSQKRH